MVSKLILYLYHKSKDKKMKKMYVAAFGFAALTMVSCGEATTESVETETEAVEVEAVTYTANTEESTIHWDGHYVMDGHNHTGTVMLSDGSMTMKGEEFVSGMFTVDLTTMKNTDMEGDTTKQGQLIGHLMSPDYFNTSEYSKVPVKVNSVMDDKMNITVTLLGNEITQDIMVAPTMDGDMVWLKGDVTLNVASANMPGMSPAEGDPAEAHVSEDIKFTLDIKMSK